MQGWLAEAESLRKMAKATLPAEGSAPGEYAQALLRIRAWQDRVEELLGQAESLRHASRRWSWDQEAAADDSFDAQVGSMKQMGQLGGDFTTGRERQAQINLLILPQLTEARSARRFHDEVDELLDRMRIIHRGMDGARQDLSTFLRWLSWEKAMER
jgi:hypothetical protein